MSIPQLSERERRLIRHYDQHERYYSPALSLIDSLDLSAVRSVLDLGCGDGRLSNALAARGIRVTGVDISEVRIATARSKGDQATFICQDLYEYLSQDHEPFDLILLFEVLEHLEQPHWVIDTARTFGPVYGSVPLNHPYKAHLQVWRTAEEVQNDLKPDEITRHKRHCLCHWRARCPLP